MNMFYILFNERSNYNRINRIVQPKIWLCLKIKLNHISSIRWHALFHPIKVAQLMHDLFELFILIDRFEITRHCNNSFVNYLKTKSLCVLCFVSCINCFIWSSNLFKFSLISIRFPFSLFVSAKDSHRITKRMMLRSFLMIGKYKKYWKNIDFVQKKARFFSDSIDFSHEVIS